VSAGEPFPACSEWPAAAEVNATLQRALFEQVALRMKAVVGQWATEHTEELAVLPPPLVHDLLVEVSVGYLVGAGLVRETPTDEPVRRPGEWRDRVPEQLRPDTGRVLLGYRRLLSELGDANRT
jgi:hypothetical protein